MSLCARDLTSVSVPRLKNSSLMFGRAVMLCLSVCMYLIAAFPGSRLSFATSQSCSGRKVLNATSGVITDGTGEYPPSAHCEWLIKGKPGQFIMLDFVSMKTECSYDYIFIYDGDSYSSSLLGSFSGSTLPDHVLAESGSMLIYFFSDRNYVLQGFYAHYSISDCPYNCSDRGICNNETHTCHCEPGHTGLGCRTPSCPGSCVDNMHGTCSLSTYLCECRADSGWFGYDCSLPVNQSRNESGWHVVLPSSDVLQPRAGHSGAFVQSKNCLYVFGGYNLNEFLNDLVTYCFRTGATNLWNAVEHSDPWPAARHAHAMTSIKEKLYMFGGILASGEHASDLWMYDVNSQHWTELAASSDVQPLAVASHTLTAVDDVYLYLFGGRSASGKFLSNMYRINISAPDQWMEVRVRGGKESDRRLVGHSAVFHSASRSLLIFGGFITDNARFPKRTNALHAFHIDRNWWSELGMSAGSSFAPKNRAFHQAVIIGDYMVVHGGNIHVHHEVEMCYDGLMYFYHLGCYTWVNHKTISAAFKESDSVTWKGRYGHLAVPAFGNTVLVVGGYRGAVMNDFNAYIVPLAYAKSMQDTRFENSSDHCFVYHTIEPCKADPECAWCGMQSSSLCIPRNNKTSCLNGSFRPSECPGICEALHSCDACVVHGRSASSSLGATRGSKPKNECAWCVKEGTCLVETALRGVCASSRNTASGLEGWWVGVSAVSTSLEQCFLEDYPAGLHWIKYRSPMNPNLPDEVTIVRNASASFQFISVFDAENNEGSQYVAVFRGFIHPLNAPKSDAHLYVYMVASAAHSVLYMSNGSNPLFKEKVAELDISAYAYKKAERSNHAPIFPDERRGFKYYAEQVVAQAVAGLANTQAASNMNLEWTGAVVTQNRPRQSLTSEFLEPFNSEGESCTNYLTCLACMTDTSCGWCVDSCIERADLQSSQCRMEPSHPALVLNATHCSVCADFVDCETCLDDDLCEWMIPEARCIRRGRFSVAVRNASRCPANCLSRTNSSWCISDKNECAWCEQSRLCFAFVEYVPRFLYGGCSEWIDSLSNDPTEDCHQITDCEHCLNRYMCGWCGNKDNPNIGICHRGDFKGVNSTSNCSKLISDVHLIQASQPSLWSYGTCPDVDECRLNLSNCHLNATCINEYGSYQCICKQGFTGDGVAHCNQTCYHACVHGRCSGPPGFECVCNVGWTGDNCSVDCGCNNHSACVTAVGTCDHCQHNTIGLTCDQCIVGSYGNPKSVQGCQLCGCNGHGDQLLGYCNSSSGICYCKDNTIGVLCEECAEGFYGDPRNGGHCYRKCEGRTIITRTKSGAIGSYRGSGTEGRQFYCLWILTVHENLESAVNPQNALLMGSHAAIPPITLTIEKDLAVVCARDFVFVYDGVPSHPGFLAGNEAETGAKLLGAFCGQGLDYGFTAVATSGSLTVFFEAIVGREYGTRGFNATYQVHSCAEDCNDPCLASDVCVNGIPKCNPMRCAGNRVCVNNVCDCKMGYTGRDCDVELCPFNCSSDIGQGICIELQHCLCYPGYSGYGCRERPDPPSVAYMPVTGPSPMNHTLNRIGHSLISCDDGALYLFGGYASGVGSLNDLWRYEPERAEWVLLRPATNEEPKQRYYHAGVCIPNVRALFIFGGIVAQDGLTRELWRYNLDSGRWNRLKISKNNGSSVPMAMAGHTMTLVDDIKVWVVGGFSSSSYFSESVFVYDAGSNWWTELANIVGSRPTGLYGHSTVFHQPSQSLYVYGGMVYSVDSYLVSDVLYALDIRNRSVSLNNTSWSVLPFINSTKPSERIFHGAVQTEQYMVIFGGYSAQMAPDTTLFVYRFQCQQWINFEPGDNRLHELHLTWAVGPAVALPTGDFYFVSLMPRIPNQLLVKLTLPSDICNLFMDGLACLGGHGCNACNVRETKQFFCYSNSGARPQGCLLRNTSVSLQLGTACNFSQIEKADCLQFKTCSECLARWPIFPTSVARVCQWCSNCPVGRCIAVDDDCDKANICNRQQRHIHDSKDCLERVCQASNCDSCGEHPRCMWTRYYRRSSETDKSLSLLPMYDWNCISNIPLNVSESGFPPETSPPLVCPTRCYAYSSCGECVRSNGAEGGARSCIWSMKLETCYPPAYLPLGCSAGQCGLLIAKQESDCPSRCSVMTTCASCLKMPRCGWCAINGVPHGGQGVCMEGGLLGPINGQCSRGNVTLGGEPLPLQVLNWLNSTSSAPTWSFTSCPPEDECNNGHMKCDPGKEICTDQVNGYSCECRNGYIMNESKKTCEPVCRQGCHFGTCVLPDVCRCNFGYVGSNCSTECQCNKHSNCRSVQETNVCLECQNSTKGNSCNVCQFLFVGNPENGGKCSSCFDLCNQHSPYCLEKRYFAPSEENITSLITNKNAKMLFSGPKSETETLCWNCNNNTEGPYCQDCRTGYFRLNDRPRTEQCQICECNGHSDVCEKERGDNCDCKNNTKSPRCDSSDALKSCYKLQCSQCIDNFLGTPTNGHQCYRQMTVDREMCFDPITQMHCNRDQTHPNLLYPNRTVFFAVQPKFQNVDIRLFLDVTKGGIDLYLSPLDNTFKVSVDPRTGVHVVSIDSMHKYSRNFADLSSNAKSRRRRADPNNFYPGTTTSPVPSTTESMTSFNKTNQPDGADKIYFLDEWAASGLVTFISITHPDTFLIVRDIKNRLVLMLPNTVHNLRISRFYLVLLGIGSEESELTSGILYYRQDQPHIDLFVFFSVFFSCFFLFLAICVIVWKTKQMIDMQRSRIRRQLEMEHMASRPFARSLIVFDTFPSTSITPPTVLPPRGNKKGPPKYSAASSAYGGVRPSDVTFHINPLALEPTSDGTAVVSTFIFQLPGGDAAPVRACLGSVLVSTRIMYPSLHHSLPKTNSCSRQGTAA